LLVLITDLQCCGDGPESWQETRRRIEARIIRGLARQVLERTRVDGIVIAGDFNLVNGTFALSLLTGPYGAPDAGLIPAELYHPDGQTTWTWDGRGTPFPSNTLDFQLYGPNSLGLQAGLILDSENLQADELEALGLERNSLQRTGRHRPLLVEYEWK
jgi:hypothetical protein